MNVPRRAVSFTKYSDWKVCFVSSILIQLIFYLFYACGVCDRSIAGLLTRL